MKILFRVDSYPEIAVGHIARCIKLGCALEKLGNQIIFISYNDFEAEKRLKTSGFEYYLTDHKINTLSLLDEEISYISEHKTDIDILIVDSYNVDSVFFTRLKKIFSFIIYLDDLGFDFNVDMVVNPSCQFESKDYIAPISLCGNEYIILDNEYSMGRTKFNIDQEILITFGGIDHFDLTSRLLPLIESISDKVKVNILIGPYYDNIKQIELAASLSKLKIKFYKDLTNISSVILKSDLAIVGGGVSVYELAAMSTPSIGIALWDNQKSNIECLATKEAIIPIYYSEEKELNQLLLSSLKKLILDKGLQAKLSSNSRSIVDGKGVSRISKIINEIYV